MNSKLLLYSFLFLNLFCHPSLAQTNEEPNEVFVTLTHCDSIAPERTFFDRFIVMTRLNSPFANIVLKTDVNNPNSNEESTLLSYLLPQSWDEETRTLKIQYKGQWYEFRSNTELTLRIDGNEYRCRSIPEEHLFSNPLIR